MLRLDILGMCGGTTSRQMLDCRCAAYFDVYQSNQRRRPLRWPMAAALFCGVLIGLIVFDAIHFWWG
jgi:hypothetical protein